MTSNGSLDSSESTLLCTCVIGVTVGDTGEVGAVGNVVSVPLRNIDIISLIKSGITGSLAPVDVPLLNILLVGVDAELDGCLLCVGVFLNDALCIQPLLGSSFFF